MEPLLSHFTKLRIQLAAMEDDLSLHHFSTEERDLICALVDLGKDTDAPSRVGDLRSHPLCKRISKPTFYRALNSLSEMGLVSRVGSERSGMYVIRPDSLEKRGDTSQ